MVWTGKGTRLMFARNAVFTIAMLSICWQLTAQQTQPAAPPPATPITLNLTDVAPDAAIAQLVKQTSYPIAPLSDAQWQQTVLARVSIKCENAPFWQAFRDICNQGGVGLYTGGYGDRRLQLVPARQFSSYTLLKCPACYSGAFVFLLHTITRNNAVDLSAPQNVSRRMQIQLAGLAEPKIKLVQGTYSPEIDEATDDKGKSLLMPSTPANPRNSMAPARGLMWQMSLPLQASAESEKIARLRGRAHVLVQTKSESFEIPNVAKTTNVTKSAAGYTILFKQLTKLDGRYQADVTISRENLDPRQAWQIINTFSVKLIDAASGQECPFSGAQPVQRPPTTRPTNQVDLKLMFHAREPRRGEAEAVPSKLVWEFITGTQEITIPFDFRDILLP